MIHHTAWLFVALSLLRFTLPCQWDDESMLLMVENTASVKACGMLGRVQLIHHPHI